MTDELYLPDSEETLSEWIRAVAEGGRSIWSIGNGTKSHWSSSPSADAAVVSLRALDRLIAYEPGDQVVVVQTGMRLSRLQAILAEHDQWLSIDPPHLDTTIGGMLATNSSGPRRLGYGTARDLLLGLRVVGATGAITRCGGRVVKNVTGYDLPKMHIGAFGSLGILTEAALRVRGKPEHSCVIIRSYDTVDASHRALMELSSSDLRPCALEVLDEGWSARLRSIIPELPKGPVLGLIGVEGTRAFVNRHLTTLTRGGWHRENHLEVFQGCEAVRLWDLVRDLPGSSRDRIRVRVGARPHDLPVVLAGCAGASRRWIRAGSGLAWLEVGTDETPVHHIETWAGKAANADGYAVVESAPLELAGRSTLKWGWQGASGIMLRLKQMWDPLRRLNPGRIPL